MSRTTKFKRKGARKRLITDLNPLSVPKGWKRECELCPMPARFICHTCRQAFYCSERHRARDMKAIHTDICSTLALIRKPRDTDKVSDSQSNRERMEKQSTFRKIDLINRTFELAKKSLYELRPGDALVQITHCLRFGSELYGPVSTEVIPFHLVKTEAFSKIGHQSMAIACMSRVEYILDQNPSCPSSVKADYYKLRGLTYLGQSNLEEAMISFAQETYYASEAYHTEHLRTASGFFNLGRVFLKRGQHTKALGLFMHTVDIWYTRLKDLAERKHAAKKTSAASTVLMDKTERVTLPLKESADAREALNFIHKSMVGINKSDRKSSSFQLVKICYTMGLYLHITDYPLKALDYLAMASSVVSNCPPGWEEMVKTLTKRCQRMTYANPQK